MDKDKVAEDILNRINKKSQIGDQREFMDKYKSKLQAPKGMSLKSIPEETARLGMKNPNLRKQAIKALAQKVGSAGLKGTSGLASMLYQDEVNPEGNMIEDPSIPLEERGPESARLIEENEEQMLSDEMMRKLKEDKMERAKKLLEEYGNR